MRKPKIQVVDANDQPLGVVAKEEAYKQGLIYRTSRIMLVRQDGKVLLQKRSKRLSLFPGRWENSVAGKVDAGETYEDAAKRELKEELDLQDIKLKKTGKYYNEFKFNYVKRKQFNTIFISNYENTPDNYSKEEVEEVKWFDIRDIKKMIAEKPEEFTDGVIEVIKRYF